MQQKAFTLQNKGMNRDLSVSKAGESSAYENHNIRITATDHDTLLSVTNERGNKEVDLGALIEGTLIGWNVLNNHIILFTHEDDHVDRIYRIDYVDNEFDMANDGEPLFTGNLNFDVEHPIESVVYFETEKIQKIYWVDGKNVLRFMNFMAEEDEIARWDGDNTAFDSNKAANFSIDVTISKDQSGNTRPNGVIQYLITYYNKHGQESGYAWISDLVYLSPSDRGGAADDDNTCKVTLNITFDDDITFTGYRVYSIFRSSLNGEAVGYLVDQGDIVSSEDVYKATVIDDYSHLTSVDVTRLLYLGSQEVHANTLAHKDQTLFLGGLESTGQDYSGIETLIQDLNLYDPETGLTNQAFIEYPNISRNWIQFVRVNDLPLETSNTVYVYSSELNGSSSEITTFKGGEKYRFAIRFKTNAGIYTPSFWIGDAVNTLYPLVHADGSSVERVVAKFVVPEEIKTYMEENDLAGIQLMVAEATYADRSIKAQGILNPTMFNTWERFNNRIYSIPSWIMRPRGSEFANKHYDVVDNSSVSTSEIQCNYWTTDGAVPTPYYYWYTRQHGLIKNEIRVEDSIVDSEHRMDGEDDFTHLMIVYLLRSDADGLLDKHYRGVLVFVVRATAKNDTGDSILNTFDFRSNQDKIGYGGNEYLLEYPYEHTYEDANYKLVINGDWFEDRGQRWAGIYGRMYRYLSVDLGINEGYIVQKATFGDWMMDYVVGKSDGYFSVQFGNEKLRRDLAQALDGVYKSDGTAHTTADRWYLRSSILGTADDYASAYYKKHLMFVDENVVTLNSPEIEYGAVTIDEVSDYKLRIVGAVDVAGLYSDYVVDASKGKLSGENLLKADFTSNEASGNMHGLTAWPLWREYGLEKKDSETEDEDDVSKRSQDYYKWGSSIVNYWLYMWNHPGKINGFTDEDNNDYGRLNSKTFANLRYSNYTVYFSSPKEYETDSIRTYAQVASQYANIKIGEDTRAYNGNPELSLSMPGSHKYPLFYSTREPDTDIIQDASNMYLYVTDPVNIRFMSTPHAVLSLPTYSSYDTFGESDPTLWPTYHQRILPKRDGETSSSFERSYTEIPGVLTTRVWTTGALLPWIENRTETEDYPYIDNKLDEDYIASSEFGAIPFGNQYLLLGEIFYDYEAEGAIDNRYGGISKAAVESCRFIPASGTIRIEEIPEMNKAQSSDKYSYVLGTRGDTYFQRYDCLKSKPFGIESPNGVIDITSVMLETHINIDGRSDKQRGTKFIASINTEQWGQINPVYSQTDNFFVSRDLDDDANLDIYKASITWTLDKADSAEIDEWSHITLANTLKLDGDKGGCNAIRRFQNSLIAFQDRAISEILFNSRTQIATTEGVPIEIANSGKVDGKRYISNKYGCVNKWSIVEGKAALYFVDNINKAFCAFNGNVESLSTSKGFNAWFRRRNKLESWTPDEFNNFVAFYDRVNSDVYLVGDEDAEGRPTLVYNEVLGEFTSFFDYDSVPMMTNVEDKFVSFKNNKLWLQHEGLYCNFFGQQYDYWVQYRVTPNPFTDKIWSGIDYRADFYRVLDENNELVAAESEIIAGDFFDDGTGIYQENTTFDNLRVWNEYQNAEIDFGKGYYSPDPARKKFRIWRLTFPRAQRSDTNKHGLDRIRNPWINLLFKKKLSESNDEDANKDFMQLHDIVVRYFE